MAATPPVVLRAAIPLWAPAFSCNDPYLGVIAGALGTRRGGAD